MARLAKLGTWVQERHAALLAGIEEGRALSSAGGDVLLNRPKIERKAAPVPAKPPVPCACCGGRAAVTLAVTPSTPPQTPPQTPPRAAGVPVALCAECIVALARGLSEVK